MTYTKKIEPETRTFVFTTGPSVADPAWMVVVWEYVGHEAKRYSDYSYIKNFIRECELKQAQHVGWMEAVNEICEHFGVKSLAELRALKHDSDNSSAETAAEDPHRASRG